MYLLGANEAGAEILMRFFGDTLKLLLTAFEPVTAGDDEEITAINLCDGQPKRSATCFCKM